MKHLLRAVVTTIALTSSAQAAQLVDYVVAVVNEDVILNSELEQAVESIERQIRASGNTPPTETELREQMRERLIMQTLQAQRAEQRGIRVTDEGITTPDDTAQHMEVALDWTDLDAFHQYLTDKLLGPLVQ